MIGIDITTISRIKATKEKFKDKFLNKILDEEEIRLIKNDKTLAGFFAAKEAFAKAIGTGIGNECSFKDIKIKKTEKNAPYFEINEKIMKKFKIKNTSLSISHDANFAIAAVIVETY